MAENKQYAHVKEITDQLEAGLHDLFESDQYRTWLSTMGRFHNYSLNNTILIAQQKPDATLVAGYTSWQKNFGRQVKRGEKAIKILAPAPYKMKEEVDKVDPETGKVLLDADGRTQKEMKEVVIPAFKVTNVFDISSTEGKELPTIGVGELDGSVQQYDTLFQALKDSCPVPIRFEEINSGAKGYYQLKEDRIAIQEGMSEIQTVKTLIHEMTHQKLHSMNPEQNIMQEPEMTRNSREVEAESVAYTICQHYGIDTSEYSFAYIAGWSQNKDTPELKASMGRIRDAACEMITEIDGHLEERLKARKDLTLEESREDKAEELAVKLDQLEEDIDPYEYRDDVSYREDHISAIKSELLEADDALACDVLAMQEIVLLDESEEIPRIEDALNEIRDFLGDDPLAEELFGEESPEVLGDNDQTITKEESVLAKLHDKQDTQEPDKQTKKKIKQDKEEVR